MISYLSPIVIMSLSRAVSETVSIMCQNLKRSRDSEKTSFVDIYQAYATPIVITLNTKFEMPSFTRFRNTIRPQKLQVGHVTLTTPIWGFFIISRLVFATWPTYVLNLNTIRSTTPR